MESMAETSVFARRLLRFVACCVSAASRVAASAAIEAYNSALSEARAAAAAANPAS